MTCFCKNSIEKGENNVTSQYSRKLAKGIKWFYKFDLNGKTFFSKLIYKTKQEAKIAEAERLNEIKNSVEIAKDNQFLLINAISERLKYLWIKSSKNYYLDNNRFLKWFYNYFGDCFIKDISKKDVHSFILNLASDLNNRGKTNNTINSAIRCYKAFYNFINENFELNLVNPFVKFKFFSIEKKLKYIPLDEEIEALLSVCDKEQQNLVKFIMETGARISEAINFYYRDINEDFVVL
jgi:site-specific recombinase XerD